MSDLAAKRREDRRSKALRLSRLGWTQKEIAEKLVSKRETIRNDLDGHSADSGILTSKLEPATIAERLGWPHQLVYAHLLDGLDDAERMEKLGIKIRPYDVWNFSGCHHLMGDEHPGRIPGELVAHVLYFYTKPGELVVDDLDDAEKLEKLGIRVRRSSPRRRADLQGAVLLTRC